jgi:hypothetical protein
MGKSRVLELAEEEWQTKFADNTRGIFRKIYIVGFLAGWNRNDRILSSVIGFGLGLVIGFFTFYAIITTPLGH